MDVFILTDLEGVAQVTRFAQSRERGPEYAGAKNSLTREVNAAIRGIRVFDPNINIHVWDGHGGGGIFPEQLLPIKAYLPANRVHFVRYFREHKINALLFVGQHAMSYTYNGNLCHTMSSRSIEYYALNGTCVGEFGMRAAIAGELGVPTIFLSGDDKACEEARNLVPEITTAEVKRGTGWESADSLPESEAEKQIYEGVQDALRRQAQISPYQVPQPITLEIAEKLWMGVNPWLRKGARRTGLRTVVFEVPSMEKLVDLEVL